MADSKDSLDEQVLSALFKDREPKQAGPAQAETVEPAEPEQKKEDDLDQRVLSAVFNTEAPSGQSESLLGSTGNTLSMGGQIVEPPGPSLVASGALGSGKFSPIPVGPKGKFDEYAGITDPDTRKGIASSFLSKITDPRNLEEISEKIPWYDMSENPVQTDSLFLYKWNKPTDPLEIAVGAAKAGVGMLESLPPLVAGAGRLAKDALGAALYVGDPTNFGKGRTLTEEQKRGMTEQQIRDAELSDRDKLIRSSRAFGDAALLAEEQLRGAVSNFAKNKGMLWDKGRVAFANATANLGDPEIAPAISVEEENARREAASAQAMADARQNFAKRLNAKHVEHMHKEKNPAVLARELEAAWQVPAVKNFATNVVELLMPPAEDYAPGVGGDLQAAKAARAADAAAAAEAGVQAAVTESNRLAEDPEQVGAIAMVTPLNVFGLGGKIVQQAGQLTRSIQRGVQAATKTPQALNAARSADAASRSAQMLEQARILEQPGMLERSLGNVADTIDRSKAAFENLPKAVKYAGSTLLGAGAGALASDDPLAGALQGAGAGAGIQLGGKALAAAPRLGQQLLKAGRMAGAEMGRFETLGKMEAASPEVQRFLKWSQKAGGGKALDFIEKNANVFVQHNVQMLPMMVALGVLEDKDAKELGEMWAEFATYGFIHGQVLGGILGNDPVRMRMDREANMRQAQRVLLASSPTTRENILNLNWDRVVEQSALRMERAQAAYTAQLEADPSSPETAKAKSDYDFARNLHRENLTAPPEARFAFEDGIKMSLSKASNLINGILTPNSNMNIELLTTQQIIQKMIDANPNYNGVGAPMTVEQALKKNPGADGSKIGKGMDAKGFMIDPAKDTVFINIDNALTKANLTGDAIPNVITHEVVGHGLFAKQEYRERIAPLFNRLFGTEVVDENGNWKQVTPAEPGLSRDELYKRFFNKYLEGKSPKEVASYAEAAGVWDEKNNTFNINEIVKLMREEVLAEAHAGQFHGDPESPAQQALNWMASRVSGENVKAALNHLYSVAGPAVYKQWTSGAVGVTYSPEVMRAIRKVENEMRKYDGDFTDAEPGEAVAAPITQKDVKKSKELLDKYFKDSGKFETTPVIIVTDAEGNVVQTVQPANKEASEGTWTYHQDEATGDNVPNKERGHGEIPPEVAGIDVPVGGRVEVRRQIAYDESTGKPKERKNKETAEYLKRRVQMLRDAIDNAGDPSEIGRFKAIPTKSGEGEEEGDMRYTGKLTRKQRDAIAALPESIVPASMKDLLFKYDDLITRGDGTVLDIDYAARLNAKGGYEAFSPRIRQVVPLRLHLSKDGNFYVKAWDLSALRRKVELYKKYAPGVFAPWGGDTEAFWKEFRTRLLPKLAEKPDAERIRQDISDSFPDLSREQVDQRVAEVYAQKLNEPAWTVLDGDPETQRLKRTIYAKMIGDPNPNIPDVESIPDIPKEKLSRSERKIDKKSPLAQIIKSYRLDAHTAAEENANTEFKYPIPYKARFLPEQEQAPQEEQRPAFSGGILKGLQAVSAKYSPTGTGEIRATVQPAEIVSQETQAPETLRTPIDQIYDTTATTVPTGDGGRGRALREYTPLKGAPIVEGATGPDPRINAAAEQYAQSRGIPVRRQGEYVTVIDKERAKRIADAYAAMPHAPNDPAVREAYADMINQTRDQYDALTDAGFKFWFTDPENDPYEAKPWRAMRDLRQNQSMGVFPTEAGFGSGETEFKVKDNPLLVDTGLMWPYGSPDGPLKRVLANDLFRAVHDAFGHGMEGAGFRAEGEENAWQAHSRLFTGKALGAMTSETRGQNSWLNFGPHGEKNKTAKVEDTIFADQKTGLMPEWTWTEGVARDEVYPEGAQMRFSPQKLDAEHAAAFEAKDEERARGLVDEAAKAAGYKYRMYRGVENDYLKGDAYVFNKADETYFTSDKQKAESYAYGWSSSSSPESGAVYDVYLKMENPWIPDRITDAQGWEYYDKKLREQGYDGVIGAHGGKAAAERGDIEVAVVFEPSQIKSADPFTYDNAGKLIPLSERFNMGTGDIRFMPAKLDSEYNTAFEAKDEERARAMVNDAAMRAGYREVWNSGASTQEIEGKTARTPFMYFTDTKENADAYSGANVNRWFIKTNPMQVNEHQDQFIDFFNPESKRFISDADKEDRAYKKTVRQLIDDSITEAQQAGFDGIEMPSEWEGKPWKNYIVFDPSQIKSADPFTYDNAGKLIPLSERFNMGTGDIRFMPNVAVVPERFTGTGEEEQRRGRYVEPPKFFKRFDISQYEPGGKFFDAETGEDLTNKFYENASIAVINGKPSLVANNEAETTGTGPLFRTNLFKQKAGWKWVSEDAPDTSTIVSVEGQGKHLYALQADFQNGVKMARYEDKASEPRLRPTGRGELALGEQVGTIDIRGKQHPVYDKVTIGEAPEAERPTRGININDSDQDYTGKILRGEKTVETRDQAKSLGTYVGKRVGIISTGKGKATLVGYADIGEPVEYKTPEEFRAAQAAHQVPEGSKYDIKPGMSKFGFPLSNIEELAEPKLIPKSGRVASDLSNIRFMPAKKEKAAKEEEQKLSPQEKAQEKIRTALTVDAGDAVSLPILQETVKGKPKLDKNKEPVIIKQDYGLVNSPEITEFSGGVVEDPSKPDWDTLAYDVPKKFRKIIDAAIDSGAVDDAVNRAVEKTERYLRNPEIAAGKGWYSRMRDNLLEALGEEKRELLSQLLGATSAKTPVNENFLQAMDGLEGIMSGRYDSNRESYLSMLAYEERGELNTLIKEKKYVTEIESKIKKLKKEAKKLTGKKQQAAKSEISKLEDLIEIPEEERTKRDRMKITILGSGLMPLRSNGKKFNANSMAVMKVIAGTWLDNRNAPKTPNFAGNLSGRTVQATIDVWAARFLRQLLYENSGQPWRIQPKSEEGVSNEDFALGQIIMERAARKLEMNPDDLQAVLWFAEKDNWEKRGWTKNVGAEKSSFDEIFHKFFPKGKKPLSFKEAIDLFAKEKTKISEEEVEDGEEEDIE